VLTDIDKINKRLDQLSVQLMARANGAHKPKRQKRGR
jgi:hypothetical protein